MSQKPVSTVAVPQSVVSAEAVSVALEAAVAKAAELGVKINVAVADSGGNLSGFLRMPGAFVQSIEMGATLQDIAATIHPHPTLGEAVQEAALRALGHALHI